MSAASSQSSGARGARLAAARLLPALALVLAVFAGCGRKSDSASAFSGARALDLLKTQCSFGPRYPGSPGHKATADWLQRQLTPFADQVIPHPFRQTVEGKNLGFENIYAVFNPNASRFILLCAHWDTRPFADQEVDPGKRRKPILGANDGASGVAVLLELARQFHERKPRVGVVIAFFDGEDYGRTPDAMFIGSKEFAQHWKSRVRPAGQQIGFDYGILLDMVGDSDLQIPKERRSFAAAPKIVEKVWSAARRAGHGDVFLDEQGYEVEDDHWPLLVAGIRCIDVIDFNYAYWHTLDDTPDKCSPNSLQTIGDTLEKLVYEEDAGVK